MAMVDLQVVSEKPEKPLWDSIGFDDDCGVIFENRITRERVAWSAPKVDELARSDPKKRIPRGEARPILRRVTPNSTADHILEAVCDGVERPVDIAVRIGVAKKNIGQYLLALASMGLITRTVISGIKTLYRPTDAGFAEHKRVAKRRALTELKITDMQERVLLAVAAGAANALTVSARTGIHESSARTMLKTLVKRGFVTETPVASNRNEYHVTDVGRVLARGLK